VLSASHENHNDGRRWSVGEILRQSRCLMPVAAERLPMPDHVPANGSQPATTGCFAPAQNTAHNVLPEQEYCWFRSSVVFLRFFHVHFVRYPAWRNVVATS
jgi:hypothetical protein